MGDPADPTFYFYGDIIPINMLSEDITRGDIIGHTGNSGARNFGRFSLAITVGRHNVTLGRAVSAQDAMQKEYPAAYENPVEKLASTGVSQPPYRPGPPVFPN